MTLSPSLAFTLVTLGILLGAFGAWAVTTWRLTREPHCLDCPCDACDRLREAHEGLNRLAAAGLTAEELAERWRKVGQAQ